MKLEHYKDTLPKLDLRDYFNGNLTANGIIQDRWGHVRNRFAIAMAGQWQGNNGTLHENFAFADDQPQQRTWSITKTSDNDYQGTADDIIGTARGRVCGNAVQWVYNCAVAVGGRKIIFNFDDWMWLGYNDVMYNRSIMRKFGIKCAEISITITKNA